MDKSLIWDDCPACAYKHLTAAYAAVTAGSAPIRVPEKDVMRARAYIALVEAEAGYAGNVDLASGCLAMAESLCDDRQDARDLRSVRLRISERGIHGTRLSLALPSIHAFAAGHFIEALRELPSLSEKIDPNAYDGSNGFTVCDRAKFTAMLRDNISWVRNTYELGVK